MRREDFGRMLKYSDGSNLLRQLKNWLRTEDNGTYQKWKEEEFDINHRFVCDPLDPLSYQISELLRDELTLLHIAAKYSNEKVVQALLGAGASVNAVDSCGRTPLDRATASNSLEVVQALLDAGADVNKQDKAKRTPLHHAAISSSSLEVVQALLDVGADVNKQDECRKTPLYYANTFNRKMVQALLDAGADPTLEDKNGKTTDDIAQQEAKRELRGIVTEQAIKKAMKVGAICGVIAGLAVGGGCFAADAALPILVLVGIVVAAAVLTGLIAGGITYAVSTKIENPDTSRSATEQCLPQPN